MNDSVATAASLSNFNSFMKGLCRIIKYRSDGEIIYIYEGLVDGVERYDLFGRLIGVFGEFIYKVVGWFYKNELYYLDGQGIFYKNEKVAPRGNKTSLVY